MAEARRGNGNEQQRGPSKRIVTKLQSSERKGKGKVGKGGMVDFTWEVPPLHVVRLCNIDLTPRSSPPQRDYIDHELEGTESTLRCSVKFHFRPQHTAPYPFGNRRAPVPRAGGPFCVEGYCKSRGQCRAHFPSTTGPRERGATVCTSVPVYVCVYVLVGGGAAVRVGKKRDRKHSSIDFSIGFCFFLLPGAGIPTATDDLPLDRRPALVWHTRSCIYTPTYIHARRGSRVIKLMFHFCPVATLSRTTAESPGRRKKEAGKEGWNAKSKSPRDNCFKNRIGTRLRTPGEPHWTVF